MSKSAKFRKPRTALGTVLIIEDAVGFVFWLGWKLADAGYVVVPAKRTSDAKKLLAKFQFEPDVLVVNPARRGAAEFANALTEQKRQLKIVALTADAGSVRHKLSRVDAVIETPNTRPAATMALRTIKRLLIRTFTA